jgi:histidyl-tRNA synthetase
LSAPSGGAFIAADFEEIVVPAIWEAATFDGKVGAENSAMMWRFKDKGDRDVCLIPEVTGLVQEMWRSEWSKSRKRLNLFSVSKVYRYERPQKGRYREFTQFNVEMLGETSPDAAKALLRACLDAVGIDYVFADAVKRGLSYYVAEGFEASVEALGAQKQVAGGGAYPEGVGWAIGVDRLMLAE